MSTFLGLPLTRPKLTDEQYVEELRSKHTYRRPFTWRRISMALFDVAILVGMMWLWFRESHVVSHPTGDADSLGIGMHIGMRDGALVGIVVGMCVTSLISCIYEATMIVAGKADRAGRLAVRYHDRLLQRLTGRTDDEETADES